MNIRTTVFRTPRFLEKVDYLQFNLHFFKLQGNNQHQRKSRQRFSVNNRNNVYDWYNAIFRINLTFEALAKALMSLVTRSRPQSTVVFV